MSSDLCRTEWATVNRGTNQNEGRVETKFHKVLNAGVEYGKALLPLLNMGISTVWGKFSWSLTRKERNAENNLGGQTR